MDIQLNNKTHHNDSLNGMNPKMRQMIREIFKNIILILPKTWVVDISLNHLSKAFWTNTVKFRY